MYIRLRMYDSKKRGTIGLIDAYGSNDAKITLGALNIVRQTYTTNTGFASQWFSGVSSGNRPYSFNGEYAEITLKIDQKVTKLSITNYSSGYQTENILISISNDGVSYTDVIYSPLSVNETKVFLLVTSKILFSSNGFGFNHDGKEWINIGKIPTINDERNEFYSQYGMSVVTKEQLKQLSSVVQSGKIVVARV